MSHTPAFLQLRAQAVALRRAGKSRREIKELLAITSNWTLKHNPRTVRKNTGADYHGCLRVDVLRGASLYRKIEGWAAAAMSDDATSP